MERAARTATDVELEHLKGRVQKLEDMEPAVLAEQVKNLAARVTAMLWLLSSVLLALIGAAISFALWAAQVRGAR